MDSPGCCLGYRALHKKVREVHALNIPRRLVYAVMQDVNPAGLQARGYVGKPNRPKRNSPFSAEASYNLEFKFHILNPFNRCFALKKVDSSQKPTWGRVHSKEQIAYFHKYLVSGLRLHNVSRWPKQAIWLSKIEAITNFKILCGVKFFFADK